MLIWSHGLVPALLSRGQQFKPRRRQPEELLIWMKVHACLQKSSARGVKESNSFFTNKFVEFLL